MKKIFILLTAAVFAVSCSDNLESLNENIKDPNMVSGESLFAAAQKRLADQMLTPNVNLNNNRLWVQHWNETTYQDESNYDQVTRSIPDNHWRVMYRDVLRNLKEAAKVIAETDYEPTNPQKPNKLAIIEILNVYAYSNLVETYGDIPYSEALDIDHTLPKFDDAMTVYKDLLQRLDAALAQLNSETSFTVNEDLIYQGNADSWRKFGNTLKLRMGMTLADVDAALSKATVESAVSGGVFASNDDTAEYAYSAAAPNNNPVNDNLVLSGRNDYVAAQTLVDIMNALKDPRRADYFDPNIRETIGTVASVSTGGGITTITFTENYEAEPIIGNNAYIPTSDPEIPLKLGVITAVGDDFIEVVATDAEIHAGDEVFYGIYKGAQPGRQSRYVEWTHVNRSMVPGDVPGVLLSYIEAEFLMAEGAARGYNVGGSAEDHYNAGIAASFEYWGTPGLSAYLANPDVAYASAIANSTATPAWKEVIGTQAWIALYNETFATWLSVRRLDYPILVQPYRAKTGYPVRYTYPVSEQNLNPTNYAEAANAIGGDAPETRLFWDKFYTFDF
ncbi:MAG TPA: SusD/RagB family nutrient-binding outer membrane lipoprotein [Flavobacteriaceae bacterium]|nr:SusD/RagB family nutrient-binding outer membrane lipoprotein [Flavobacteriaceae bacterium]